MAESVVEERHTPSGGRGHRPKRRARLNAKRKLTSSIQDEDNKTRITFDNFCTFCSYVLEYELASETRSQSFSFGSTSCPMNSAGESSVSSTPSSSDSSSGRSEASDGGEGEGMDSVSHSADTDDSKLEYTSDDESWNLVTCFCRRPFAGRPMIECSKCGTWIHLFCAKVKKDHVPEIYICPSCRSKTS